MGKFIGFIICLITGVAVILLSIINEYFYCSHSQNICLVQSKLAIFNTIVSESKFSPSDINKAFCDTKLQPSRSGGKKQYYVLKISLNSGNDYSLGSYQKYNACKIAKDKINNFKKHKTEEFSHGSGLGYSNTFGIIFGIILFFVGYLIVTSKEEVKKYDWEDEDEDENNSD